MDLSQQNPTSQRSGLTQRGAYVDPPQLPPAVVALLLDEGIVTEAVFSRAVLALVDEGWLTIDPEDSGVPLIRIARMPAPGQVRPYEQLVLDRVAQRMGDVAHVPLSALMSNDGDDYKPWWRKFQGAVTAEARSHGLMGRQLRDFASCLLPFALTGAAVGVTSTVASGGAATLAGITAFVVGCVMANRAGNLRLTERGQAAAVWWRENGGGLTGTVIADRLPPGAAPAQNSNEALIAQHARPLPDGFVWSSFGGRWHTLKVGPLDVPSFGRPRTAVSLMFGGFFFSIPAFFAGHVAIGGSKGTLIALAPAAFFGALLLLGWLPANLKRRAIPTRATFTGQVVKRWTYESGGEDSTTYYCLSVDDGVSAEGWSFRTDQAVYYPVQVGDQVTVEFNPRWHTVRRITPAAAPTAIPGQER